MIIMEISSLLEEAEMIEKFDFEWTTSDIFRTKKFIVIISVIKLRVS